MAQQVKNLPAMQESQERQVQSLGREDPLEEENGNPLQYSCLKNPMDRGAWQAAVQRSKRDGLRDCECLPTPFKESSGCLLLLWWSAKMWATVMRAYDFFPRKTRNQNFL